MSSEAFHSGRDALDLEEATSLLAPNDAELVLPEEAIPTPERVSRKFNNKLIVAAIASLSLVGLAVYSKPTAVKNMPAAASLKEIDPTVDFVTGERRSTEFVADGLTDVLVGDALGITCDDNALIGFSLDVKKDDTIGYNYYCDDTGAPMENKNHRVTDNSIEPESGVGQLSVFDVDCSNVGLNYVLTYLKMKEMDSGNYAYSYGCATYELGMLTCAQFYTDLAAESDIDHSVSTLRDHPVQCFEGSALQKFRYQRVDDEVRYSYMCCTKAHIPTPSPTPLPTMEPSPEPTLEPVAKPTNEPVAKATMMPGNVNANKIHMLFILMLYILM